MQKLARDREGRLIESKKLYRFLRESEEVAEWIGDQTTIAASEDYGRDVEHVELLIQVWVLFSILFSARYRTKIYLFRLICMLTGSFVICSVMRYTIFNLFLV